MRPELTAYLDQLDRLAREESAAEDAYRREIASKVLALEQRRAFAFRRLNLMRSIASSVSAAKDEAEALTLGSGAFMRETGWNGATEIQRRVIKRFEPVVLAIWEVGRPDDGGDTDVARIADELAAFEAWFLEDRSSLFLGLMEREVPELPLVET